VETIPLLLINSVWDIKFKYIIGWLTIIWTCIGIGLRICSLACEYTNNGEVRIELWIGTIIAIGILGISYLTKEKIGYGDGLIILGLSAYIEVWGLLEILLIAGMLAAVTAIILMGLFHKKRDYEIPFVPYIAAGTILYFIGGVLQ